jgi:hypothetical protein
MIPKGKTVGMSIRTHQLLVRLVFSVGMVGGVALFWVALWLTFGVLGLPRPSDETVVGAASALVVCSLFFFAVYGGGRMAIFLFQRRVRVCCPACRAAVGVKIWMRTMGEYRCRACGYVHPPT